MKRRSLPRCAEATTTPCIQEPPAPSASGSPYHRPVLLEDCISVSNISFLYRLRLFRFYTPSRGGDLHTGNAPDTNARAIHAYGDGRTFLRSWPRRRRGCKLGAGAA